MSLGDLIMCLKSYVGMLKEERIHSNVFTKHFIIIRASKLSMLGSGREKKICFYDNECILLYQKGA